MNMEWKALLFNELNILQILPARNTLLSQENPSSQNENSRSSPLSQCEGLRQLALKKEKHQNPSRCIVVLDMDI
jgi:hypothetical protein